MANSVTAQYAAGVAAGRIERDDAQLAVVDMLARLESAHRRISPGAQIVVARLAVRRPREARAADQGPLHLRRRRPRQDHADGFVLRSKPGRAQAPRAFSRIHARRARAHSRHPAEDEARRACRRRSDPARRRAAGARGVAALLRRISRHRYRRRHDPRPAVHAACSSAASWWSRRRTWRPTSSTRTASTARCSCHSSTCSKSTWRSCGSMRAPTSGWKSSPACRCGTCRPTPRPMRRSTMPGGGSPAA